MRLEHGWLSAFAIASCLALVPQPAAAASPGPLRSAHHGDALLRVEAWPQDLLALGLDVWTHGTTTPSVLVRVTPQQRAQLDITGFDYEVVEPDLGPRVEAEAARLAAATRPVPGGLDPAFHDDYRDLGTVLDRLDALALAVPERVSPVVLGDSFEGRSIVGVRLSNPSDDTERPVIVVAACQHAREWISVAATIWAAEALALAPAGSELDGILDGAEVVLLPVLNPDGYVHTWGPERYWRKNRRDDHGVDLNRNWSVAWGGEGSSPYPFDENYRGDAPFSEPEAAALRDFIDAEPQAVALLDVHSFGQLVLYPWGFEPVPAPDDVLLTSIGDEMAAAMAQPHDTAYLPLQSADLYPAAGNAMDWAYGERGLHAFALELRPGMGEDPGFLLEPEQIVPTGEELLLAIVTLAEATIDLGPGDPGDSGGPMPMDGDSTSTGGGLDDTSGGLDGTAGPGSTGDEGPEPPPGGTGTGEGSGDAGASDDASDQGCGCRGGGSAPTWWAWVLGPWLLRPRRRR